MAELRCTTAEKKGGGRSGGRALALREKKLESNVFILEGQRSA